MTRLRQELRLLAGRLASTLPQSAVNTVTTQLGVAMFAFNGNINCGVTGDRDGAPDIELFCHAIERNVALLLSTAVPKVAGRRSGAGRRHVEAQP